MKNKMSHRFLLVLVFITICASNVRSLQNKTSYNSLDDDFKIHNFNTTNTSVAFNHYESKHTASRNDLSESVDNKIDEQFNTTLRDRYLNDGNLIRHNSLIVNDTLTNTSHKTAYKSNRIADLNFVEENLNATNINDIINVTDDENSSLTLTFPSENELLKEDHDSLRSTKDDASKDIILKEKKVILQHHLHLVPMEDKPLDSMMLKSERYLISILVPVGVGMIGAVMIACTVVTLRGVARKRPVHIPLDNDAEAERSMTSHISSISTETTDKVFLLHSDEI